MTPPDPRTLLADAASIRGLARALVGDIALADDVAQEALMRRLGTDDGQVQARRAWLAGIVRHAAGTLRRGEARRAVRERRAARAEALPSAAEILEAEDLRREVVEAVLALDEPMRNVMLLHHLKELPMREVARQLGIPLETARTRNKRGLALLRERLDRRFGERGSWAAVMSSPWIDAAPPVTGLSVPAAPAALTLSTLMTGKSIAFAGLVIVALAAWRWSGGGEAGPPDSRGPQEASHSLPALPSAGDGAGLAGSQEITPHARRRPAAPSRRSDAESPSATAAGVRIIVVNESDGAPVPKFKLVWTEGNLSSPRSLPRVATTDTEGVVELSGLRAGRFELLLETLQAEVLELQPGELHELRIEAVAGALLSGTVRDADGRPIEAAEIVIEGMNTPWFSRFPATLTDANGRYELRHLNSDQDPFVGARAIGFGPSNRILLRAPAGSRLQQDFVLDRPGAVLRGEVVDEHGTPVPNASIHVGKDWAISVVQSVDGAFVIEPPPLHTASDDEGRFEAPNMPAGTTELNVLALGYGRVQRTVEVVAGVDAFLRVQLNPPSALHGVVRDAAGNPLPWVTIQADHEGMFGLHTRTVEDGSYLLEGLPVGEFAVEASHREFIDIQTRHVGSSGQTAELDLILTRGASLSGFVDCPGVASDGWIAAAEGWLPAGDYAGETPEARVDAQGRFELVGLHPEAIYAVVIRERETWRTLGRTDGVSAGDPDVRVSIDPTVLEERTVFLTGRIVDGAGSAVPSASFVVHGPGAEGSILTLDSADGSFRAGPFLPGEFSLLVRATGYPRLRTDTLTASAGETSDFGLIHLQHGGLVEVRFRREPGVTPGVPAMSLRGGAVGTRFTPEGDRSISAPSAPGEYLISVFGGGDSNVAQGLHPVSVVAGETTEVELVLQRGYARELRVLHPATEESGPAVHLEVRDSTDAIVHTGVLDWRLNNPVSERSLRLATGTYTIEVRTDTGLRAELEAPFDPAHESVPLNLELGRD